MVYSHRLCMFFVIIFDCRSNSATNRCGCTTNVNNVFKHVKYNLTIMNSFRPTCSGTRRNNPEEKFIFLVVSIQEVVSLIQSFSISDYTDHFLCIQIERSQGFIQCKNCLLNSFNKQYRKQKYVQKKKQSNQ